MKRPSREEIARIETEPLPTGGYIVGILGAEEITYDWGTVIEFKFDISDGDYKNYYTQQYKNSQFENKKYKGTLRVTIPQEGNQYYDSQYANYWRNIYAIEDSNPKYRFESDELDKLKGKKVGIVMFEKEWELNGRKGMAVMAHSFRSIEDIKANKFKIPKPKLLKNSNENKPKNDPFADFEELPSDDNSDLPF